MSDGMNRISEIIPGNRRCCACGCWYEYNPDPRWYLDPQGKVWGICCHCHHDVDKCREHRQVGTQTPVRVLQ